MSNTDSFIDEVTEEVRRDKLFAQMRRYGWIAVLLVLLIVGGAAYNEWKKASERAAAEALGDDILAALEADDRAARADALAAIDAPTPGADAVVTLLAAGEAIGESPAETAEMLLTLADRGDVPLVYRQIATLKATAISEAGLSPEERRERLDGLALGGGIVRLLAEEQLAYLDIEAGETDAALERLEQIAADAEASQGLRRRVSQVIVALGGDVAPAQDAG
ncbi:hypothetical protein K1T73_15340 [Roseovarius sp. SCSIO 43702]|uniref:hypothetical protein n=1 Tax=Roseovarius sp. SCSIO 43702 TaxID=2823043 RepID=UPI001C72EDCA|nr:hypothetical protein [Roseovarius sp. SCSIO 43702]QYX56409.1 hypothetical protein K1T73_15340 [Roseovarius sp. SCSIO 43702]